MPEPYPGRPATLATYKQAFGPRQQGALTAPFEGIQGWLFTNSSEKPVVVKLRLSGLYELIPSGQPGNKAGIVANIPTAQARPIVRKLTRWPRGDGRDQTWPDPEGHDHARPVIARSLAVAQRHGLRGGIDSDDLADNRLSAESSDDRADGSLIFGNRPQSVDVVRLVGREVGGRLSQPAVSRMARMAVAALFRDCRTCRSICRNCMLRTGILHGAACTARGRLALR